MSLQGGHFNFAKRGLYYLVFAQTQALSTR
jgi:hypothetical protein